MYFTGGLHNLYNKWNVKSRYGLVIEAFNRGFLDDFLKLQKNNDVTRSGKLTKRETEVLKFLCERQTLVGIAKILSISHRTAEGHLAKIRFKWNAHTAPDLIYSAIKQGYLIVAKREAHRYEVLFTKNNMFMAENMLL